MSRLCHGSLAARALALLGSLSFAGACSCGQQSTPVMSSTGSSGGSGGTTSSSKAGTGGGGGGNAPKPEPCPDWPGWETWDDFAPSCPFCVPASKAALPAPIAWVPCDARAGIPSGCQTMKVDWPFIPNAAAISPASSGDVASSRKVVLSFTRLSRVEPHPYVMDVVAEADGPVLSAMIDTRSQIDGCHLSERPVRHGKAIFSIRGDTPNSSDSAPPSVIVGGNVDELHPRILAAWQSWNGGGLSVSDLYWGIYDSYKIRRFRDFSG